MNLMMNKHDVYLLCVYVFNVTRLFHGPQPDTSLRRHCQTTDTGLVHRGVCLLITAPNLEVYYFFCRWLCLSGHLSVCLSVCHKHCFFFFLFLDGIEPFLGHQFSMTKTTKLFSSIFDLGPQRPKFTPQNLHLHKIAYNLACMADRPEMFGPTRGFSGMADSIEPCKMLWDRPLLPWLVYSWLSLLLIVPSHGGMAKLSWPGWLVTYQDGLPARRRVTHPNGNRARRTITSLIETNALVTLPMCQPPHPQNH